MNKEIKVEILCIGGSHDGERVEIGKTITELYLMKKFSKREIMSYPEKYIIERIVGDSTDFYVGRYEHLEVDHMLAKLTYNYKRMQ